MKNLNVTWSLIILISVFLIFGCREEQEALKNSRQQEYSAKIGYKKLSEIPEILPSVEKVKTQIQSNPNVLGKGIREFDLDQDNILVMKLNDNGRKISIIVNHDDDVTSSYFVMNLNIVQHDGIESYFITKYIPADGKPFYSYSDFVGTIEFYDLDGNLLSTSQPSGRHLAFILG